MDVLRGRVMGTSVGQRIVVYALGNNTWWVQPLTIRPFVQIAPDGSWSTVTHLGTKYAALLVNPGFVPASQLPKLPVEGGPIAALATATPSSVRPSERHLQFSNYEWSVRQIGSDRNGSPHAYSVANASVDARGFLHLAMSKGTNGLECSEVALSRSLGYGTYAFAVEDVSQLDPAAVFSIFTWDEAGTDQDRREVDSVVSHWGGDAKQTNAQYIVQPFFRPANTYRYSVPQGLATFIFRWEPERIDFRTQRGDNLQPSNNPLAEHTFTADVPSPRTETVHFNLCTFDYARVPQRGPAEVILRRFQFQP